MDNNSIKADLLQSEKNKKNNRKALAYAQLHRERKGEKRCRNSLSKIFALLADSAVNFRGQFCYCSLCSKAALSFKNSGSAGLRAITCLR